MHSAASVIVSRAASPCVPLLLNVCRSRHMQVLYIAGDSASSWASCSRLPASLRTVHVGCVTGACQLMYDKSVLLSTCRGSEVGIQAMALRLVAAVVAGLGEGGRSSLTVQQDALRAADR